RALLPDGDTHALAFPRDPSDRIVDGDELLGRALADPCGLALQTAAFLGDTAELLRDALEPAQAVRGGAAPSRRAARAAATCRRGSPRVVAAGRRGAPWRCARRWSRAPLGKVP